MVKCKQRIEDRPGEEGPGPSSYFAAAVLSSELLGVSRAEHVAQASGEEELGVQSLGSGTVLANTK